MRSDHTALWTRFMRSAQRHGRRPALVVEDATLTYEGLWEIACRIAATIQAHPECSETPLTAVFAYRTRTAFAGVLASLLAGNGYVPLNRTFPVQRTREMLERSLCRSLVVDTGSVPQLDEVIRGAHAPMLIIMPDASDLSEFRAKWPQHTCVGAADLSHAETWREPTTPPDAIAYLLFTSGSTGVPKGVMVANRNVAAFVEYMVGRYAVTEQDRFSQLFDMTFDLSAFDMFVAWDRGACVCCPSQKTLIKPGRFVQDMGLTVWFSVPSTAVFMKQWGELKPGRYPTLRWSLFCGEPLPVSSASAWLGAAPNSTLENLYGPTELTIACTLYRWDPAVSAQESEMGIVPIGYPYPGMKTLVVDEALSEVAPGQEGELLMTGPQMSLGYWRDPDKTAAAFMVPPGKAEVFYRTGDRVRRPRGDGPLTHLGRADSQVKILGHRAELGEIESAVRETIGRDAVVAVGWPVTARGCDGVEVFIEGPASDGRALAAQLRSRLPEYMVPSRYHFRPQLPRNVNNKLDRKAMLRMLEEGL